MSEGRQHESQQLEQARQIAQLINEVGSRHYVATSPDGLITAKAVATGQIVGLEIDPRIYRHPNSKALARSILETLSQAIDGASGMHLDGLARVSGVQVETFNDLLESAKELMHQMSDDVEDSKRSSG